MSRALFFERYYRQIDRMRRRDSAVRLFTSTTEDSNVTSPLETRLLQKIESSADPEARAVSLAELGSYWARTGEFERSEGARQELRREFGDGHSLHVSILIMLLEAHLLYFRELSPNARDRLARASLLSKAANARDLVALTSSWMAHLEFNQARHDAMVDQITLAIDSLAPENVAAECRIALVLGDCFLYVGNRQVSQSWYERARRAANILGDHAAIGALTYNRAALRVARTRVESILGGNAEPDVVQLRLDVESAINYQRVARLISLEHLLSTAKIGVLLLASDFESALNSISELLSSAQVPPDSAQELMLRADKALALGQLGYIDGSREILSSYPESRLAIISPDDRAVALDALRAGWDACGDRSRAAELHEHALYAATEHQSNTVRLKAKLERFAI